MYCAAKMYLFEHYFLEQSFMSMQKSNKWRQVTLAKNKTTSLCIFMKLCLCQEISIPSAPNVSIRHAVTYQSIWLRMINFSVNYFHSYELLLSTLCCIGCILIELGFHDISTIQQDSPLCAPLFTKN